MMGNPSSVLPCDRLSNDSKTVIIYKNRALAIEVETEMDFVRWPVETKSATPALRRGTPKKESLEEVGIQSEPFGKRRNKKKRNRCFTFATGLF